MSRSVVAVGILLLVLIIPAVIWDRMQAARDADVRDCIEATVGPSDLGEVVRACEMEILP